MHILLVNTYEKTGGAARATGRLFNGLKEQGADVMLLVQDKRSTDVTVVTPGGKTGKKFLFLRPYIDFAIPLLQTRKRILFSTSLLPDGVQKAIEQIAPDIVHLNWITGGMVKLETLSKIEKPLVWTFHDLWAFTGGCHYPAEHCFRYKEGCGSCPLLHSHSLDDLSHQVFVRKQKVYAKIDHLAIITPSHWLAERVKESPLLGSRHVEVIPNGLDTTVFYPGEKSRSKTRFGLPKDKKLILFGGIRGVQNMLKGFDLLVEALHYLINKDYELVVFGSGNSKISGRIPIPTRFMGYIDSEKNLAELYSAMDVVVVPSRQEVFGQTASEALSCGVPVVAFPVGGLTDIVTHKKNGYMAEPFKPEDLATGIEWVLNDTGRYRELSTEARKTALEKFDIRMLSQKTITFYTTLVNGYQIPHSSR